MTRWIHGIRQDLLRAAFSDYFGVSEDHADILCILFGRPGEWVTTKKMQALLNSHRPPKRSVVYERVRVLREIMEAESLISGGQLDGIGYTLTEVGFSECQRALRAMAQVLTRSGPEIKVPGEWVEDLREPEEPKALLPPPLVAAKG